MDMLVKDECGLPKEYQFFLFLLEYYADAKGISGADVLDQWDKHGITNEIMEGYEIYHIESLDNAVKDIDSLINTGKHI